MNRDPGTRGLSRRAFVKTTTLASGLILAGFDLFRARSAAAQPSTGSFLGLMPFVNEPNVPLEIPLGAGLDGRLYTNLAALTPAEVVTPTEKFYVRTRSSALLDASAPWRILIKDRSARNVTFKSLSLSALEKDAGHSGVHVLECAGNSRTAHFGMLSAAEWSGVPITHVLDQLKRVGRACRVLISGFDRYPISSVSSAAGASWIFTRDELRDAFLALKMNGESLTPDHGAPVRLIVPGWYGCACIKWVNEITFVEDDVEASSQMTEFAVRTHQEGTPKLARDFRPARIQQAAMPVRVEKWLEDGRIGYRVIGLLWGGSERVRALQIRFNPEEDYVPVDSFDPTLVDPESTASVDTAWSIWSHYWTPKTLGTYSIRLRVSEPAGVSSIRLDSGFYVRSVEILEV